MVPHLCVITTLARPLVLPVVLILLSHDSLIACHLLIKTSNQEGEEEEGEEDYDDEEYGYDYEVSGCQGR